MSFVTNQTLRETSQTINEQRVALRNVFAVMHRARNNG